MIAMISLGQSGPCNSKRRGVSLDSHKGGINSDVGSTLMKNCIIELGAFRNIYRMRLHKLQVDSCQPLPRCSTKCITNIFSWTSQASVLYGSMTSRIRVLLNPVKFFLEDHEPSAAL